MSTHRELTTSDLLGLGLSPRSAYTYGRVWVKLEAALAARNVDFLTCTAADIGVIGAGWNLSHSARSQLRSAFRHAWDVLERDSRPSLAAVRIPPQPRMRCLAIEPDAAAELELAARNRGDVRGLAVLIGLYTALRRAEIARLRWDDFTVDKFGRLEWLTVCGKGDVTADIPVHPVLAELLCERYQPTGWVFPNRAGGSVCPTTIWEWVRKVGADAGVPVRTHVLRHTALAEANDRSGDLRAVMELARHSRPEITAGYTRTTSAKLKAVVAMIDYGRSAA